ncbi:MAG: DUF5320 family protein [Acidimicrobiales bacterium]
MPNRDGTGPFGDGPYGRRLGPCGGGSSARGALGLYRARTWGPGFGRWGAVGARRFGAWGWGRGRWPWSSSRWGRW